MAVYGWIYIEMPGKSWKQLEMAAMAGYGCKWVEMAGNGWKWNGLITIFGIWGV